MESTKAMIGFFGSMIMANVAESDAAAWIFTGLMIGYCVMWMYLESKQQ